MCGFRLAAPAFLSVVCFAPSAVLAEHANITLEISGSGAQQTSHMDQTPPESGKTPRPVIKVKAGDTIKIQWIFKNTYPHKTLENVVMHFFVARQEKVGQKQLPDLREPVLETAFDMDFKPGTKAGARTSLKIDTPGVYLVRVESKNTQSDHEHFSAIDLVIEPANP